MPRKPNYELIEYIKKNIGEADAITAKKFNVSLQTICRIKKKLGVERYDKRTRGEKIIDRAEFIATLPEKEKVTELKKDLKSSALFKEVKKTLTEDEKKLYEEQFIEFMMDPTIETMTASERDSLHHTIMLNIQIFRLREDELLAKKQGKRLSRVREIKECQDMILKYQENLNVSRKQRLKNQNDQAISFSSLIKELKDPSIRGSVGEEAAMLKWMAEKTYNDKLGQNILSGKNNPFDVSTVFKSGVVPSGLTSNFTGEGNE